MSDEAVETQTAPEASSGTSSAAPEVSTQTKAAQDSGVEAVSTQPAFTPNYKVKVMEQEFEIDEMFRGLMKDPESEKKVKEIFEKAYGIDYFKPRFENLRKEHGPLKEQHTVLTENLNQLSHLAKTGDFGTLFDAVQIPRQAIFKWVADEVRKMDLPPEDQQALMMQEQVKRENYTQQNLIRSLQENYERTQVQLRDMQLSQVMAAPEVRSAQQEFDARVGKPGAFRNLVIERGLIALQQLGQDITAEQAVKEALAIVGTGSATVMASQPQAVAQPTPPPVIPNIGSSGGSPAKRAPRSIDDLKKLAAEM